jgi:uncharacterized protein involved in tolerance to divalent cations
MNEIVTVSIACSSEDEANTIARHLVEQRLAACVQSHAITSTYRWRGAVETAPEVMLTAKTLAGKLGDLEAAVRRLHSYDVPEILAQPVMWASDDYAAWLKVALE